MLLFFIGCNTKTKQIKQCVENMMENPVSLQLNKMRNCRIGINKNKSEYKMIVYVDSSECTPCSMSKLRFWNPIIETARKKKIRVEYIFIVAPKPSEMEDINLELSITDLQSSIYLDTAYVFRKSNPSIPAEKKYHSFLLDKNNKIVFVGSPVENEQLKRIYNKTIGL